MIYNSLNKKSNPAAFPEAVVRGIAPDRGLYFPEKIHRLPDTFFDNIEQESVFEIAFQAIAPFVEGSIPENELRKIIEETLDFDFPIVPITDQIGTLELFQGPTLAFKDVGARFMARCLGYFNKENTSQKVTVLVATSGDTGGAVANGFLGVPGIEVVILYPKGKVSEVQEQQLTTLGQNITALEVDGVFDDCQDMVKTAFLDQDITQYKQLTSANSINIARWLPQMFYYFIAYRTLKKKNKPLVVSVPSGNFGNICAGLMAREIGLPIDHFIASTNINDVVPDFLTTGVYTPKKSSPTISNAMDVGDPSNFIRILKIFGDDLDNLKETLSGYRFTDDETREALKEIYTTSGYVADPHGAVGYLGLKAYLKDHPEKYGIFLETAHPVKFLDTVEDSLNIKVDIPERLKETLSKTKKSIPIQDYQGLKDFLLR
ncbi:MAG: threonine synthase [Flavobacteriaceae bacterium]|jgi:threonine synthase|nr:threonine synthase [Candidatus Arcticimaribacter sp.]